VTNHDYRQLNQVSDKTAYLELDELVQKGLLKDFIEVQVMSTIKNRRLT